MSSPQAPSLPFGDEFARVQAVATKAVTKLVANLPKDLLSPDVPRTQMVMGVWIEEDANVILANFGIDYLGALLSDQFGAMQLNGPESMDGGFAFRLAVLVPADVELLRPLLESALEAIVRTAIGPEAEAAFTVRRRMS